VLLVLHDFCRLITEGNRHGVLPPVPFLFPLWPVMGSLLGGESMVVAPRVLCAICLAAFKGALETPDSLY